MTNEPNKTDAGNGSNGICRVIDTSRSPWPDPKHQLPLRFMTIIALSEDDYYEHLDRPHNPPGPAIATDGFDEEYYKLFDRVAAIMSDHGENNAYGEGDYCLESRIAPSRGLGLEITNASIVDEPLLRRLQILICQHAPHWEIYLSSAQFDFGIFIGPTTIQMHRRNDNLLPQLNEFVADVP